MVTAMPALARLSISRVAPMIFMASPWNLRKKSMSCGVRSVAPETIRSCARQIKEDLKGTNKAGLGLGLHFVQGDPRRQLDQLQTGLAPLQGEDGQIADDHVDA